MKALLIASLLLIAPSIAFSKKTKKKVNPIKTSKCKQELRNNCSGLTPKECLKSNYKKFSPYCAEGIMNDSPIESRTQECVKMVEKKCGASDDLNCEVKARAALPSDCRQKIKTMEAGNPVQAAMFSKCLPQMNQLCQLDEKLLDKNPDKAVEKLRKCMKAKMKDVQGDCRKTLGMDNTEYDKILADGKKRKKKVVKIKK